MVRVAGDADRRRRLDRHSIDRETRRERGSDGLGDRFAFDQQRRAERDGELVTAQASDRRMRRQVGGKATGNALQQLIADCMPEGVVDLFETVEVEQKDDRSCVRGDRVRQATLELIIEEAPIRQARQRVVLRVLLDCRLGLLLEGHIRHDAAHLDSHALAITPDAHRITHDDRFACPVDHAVGHHERRLAAFADRVTLSCQRRFEIIGMDATLPFDEKIHRIETEDRRGLLADKRELERDWIRLPHDRVQPIKQVGVFHPSKSIDPTKLRREVRNRRHECSEQRKRGDIVGDAMVMKGSGDGIADDDQRSGEARRHRPEDHYAEGQLTEAEYETVGQQCRGGCNHGDVYCGVEPRHDAGSGAGPSPRTMERQPEHEERDGEAGQCHGPCVGETGEQRNEQDQRAERRVTGPCKMDRMFSTLGKGQLGDLFEAAGVAIAATPSTAS